MQTSQQVQVLLWSRRLAGLELRVGGAFRPTIPFLRLLAVRLQYAKYYSTVLYLQVACTLLYLRRRVLLQVPTTVQQVYLLGIIHPRLA